MLGVAWDGAGYGPDGTIWGGEFLRIVKGGWRRVAHLRPFRLPGGEAAVREPRRAALGLLYAAFGEEALGDGRPRPRGGLHRRRASHLGRHAGARGQCAVLYAPSAGCSMLSPR